MLKTFYIKLKENIKKQIIFLNYKKFNKKFFKNKINKSEGVILVEFNKFLSSHIFFALISNYFKKKKSYKIYAFNNHYLTSIKLSKSLKSKIMWFIGEKFNINLFGIYNSFGVEKIIEPKFDRHIDASEKIFNQIIQNIKSKDDILDITINNIPIGDVVYDGYRKYTKKFTIEKDDESFRCYLNDFIKLFLFWHDYIKHNKIEAVISAHGYYAYALVLRIAVFLNKTSLVMEFGQLFKLSKDRYLPHCEYKDYKKIFNSLDIEEKKKLTEKSLISLNNRFSGLLSNKIDEAVTTKSAFRKAYSEKEKVLKNNSKIKVLIATHNTEDVYNCHGRNFFSDFYEWLDFLGKISEKTQYDWYIKNHPYYSDLKYALALDNSYKLTDQIIKKYKKIKLIPSDTSHHQIINEGINFVLTVYGTISWEYAYFGVPVLTATKNNRTVDYKFNIQSENKEDYENKILNLSNINFKCDRNEVIDFYSMRYIYNGQDNLLKIMTSFLSNKKINYDFYDTALFYDYLIKNLTKNNINEMEKILENFFNSEDYMLSKSHINNA